MRSSLHRSPLPRHKRYRSRSPRRRRSRSPSSSRKPVKRRCSPPRTSSRLAPCGKSSSSSVSPERLAPKKRDKHDSMDKIQGRGENERTKDLSTDRIMHRAKLLKFANKCFNVKSLRDEFRDELYEEFEAEKNETCFKLEEEFDIYKKMPKIYEKYEEWNKTFMKMYQTKYPNYNNEERKMRYWKLYFEARLVPIEKAELRNRLLNLRRIFRQKLESIPPPPPPPVISVVDIRFEQSISEAQSQGSMMKEAKESKISEGGVSVGNFSIDKAIADLELMVPELGLLGVSINAILSDSKEEGINSEKSLKSFADPDNVSIMEFALTKMKAKCKEDRKDFYSSLERSVNGLIKYAKEELEKREKKELPPLDYEAIAKATVGKNASDILKMIRAAALLMELELTKEQENEICMKVCSIHFNLDAK